MSGIILDFDADKFLIYRIPLVFRSEFSIRIKGYTDFTDSTSLITSTCANAPMFLWSTVFETMQKVSFFPPLVPL